MISRRLLTRDQTRTPDCNHGKGRPRSADADFDYRKAPFFNVLAAFWIQFMTHDWFAHPDDARNDVAKIMSRLGCATERDGARVVALTPERAAALGCRPEDAMEAVLVADDPPAPALDTASGPRLARAQTTTRNFVTAWWDASQIYGFDERSARRVKRDPDDPAKLLVLPAGDIIAGERRAQGVTIWPRAPLKVYPIQLGLVLGVVQHVPCEVDRFLREGDRVGSARGGSIFPATRRDTSASTGRKGRRCSPAMRSPPGRISASVGTG